MKAHPVSGFIAAVSSAALVIAALCCAACLQELPLGDKYINEAAGFLRVQNSSAKASYILDGFELRDAVGKTVQSWDDLNLQKGETWTGDVDREGMFILYCTVATLWDDEKKTEEVYKYGNVEIKLHEVSESKIMGEALFVDTDEDGFSDSWEQANGFKPNDKNDGGMVYVDAGGGRDDNPGTALLPYQSMAKGVEKASYGLTGDARTVVVTGEFKNTIEGGSNESLIHITDTGPHGLTVRGAGSAIIDGQSKKRAIYLGPGTKLTLENITIQNGYALRGGGVHADAAELILGAGIVIKNCYAPAGGSSGSGVYASGGASVVMEDGSLIGSGNSGWRGVGVALLDGSSLTMKNGSCISGNHSIIGGAVEADLGSLVTLEPGSKIINNTDNNSSVVNTSRGGGLRIVRGSRLLMEGGLIANNTIKRGGGTGTSGGGGVYVSGESEMEMRGGEIRENTAGFNTVTGNGGGVYVDTRSVFRMTGGSITKNTAKGIGGGVYVDGGKFIKTGGEVYGSGIGVDTALENTATGGNHAFAATDRSTPNTLAPSFTYP